MESPKWTNLFWTENRTQLTKLAGSKKQESECLKKNKIPVLFPEKGFCQDEILEILKNLFAQIELTAIQTRHIRGTDRLQF